MSDWFYGWIHIINSKEDYERLWKYIGEIREIYLGNFLIINGSLTCKDGRVIGNEGEKMVAITTMTYEKEPMETMIKSRIINPSMTVLITDLDPDELIKTNEGANLIKKRIKDFEKPSEFKKYLRKIGFKI